MLLLSFLRGKGHGDKVRGESSVSGLVGTLLDGPQLFGAIAVEVITSDADCFPEVVAVLPVQNIQRLVRVQ